MLALCWHNTSTYYALNYAGIIDRGLYNLMHMHNYVFYLELQIFDKKEDWLLHSRNKTNNPLFILWDHYHFSVDSFYGYPTDF